MPLISESTCSAGVATRCSTSCAVAPGKGMNTLAKVTLIWGSSSRGVISTASSPNNSPTRAMSGVSWLSWKKAAMRPETPRRRSAALTGRPPGRP